MTAEKKLVKFERIDAEWQSIHHIIYYISGHCKFNCSYCDVIDNNRRNEDFESQQKIVDAFLRLNKQFEIYFYGGEPTEYMYLHEITQHILNNRTEYLNRIELQTNLNISHEEVKKYLEYDLFEFSPSIHLTFLKGDTLENLITKLITIRDRGRLRRIDFMLEKWSVEKHVRFNDMLIANDLDKFVEYRDIYFEPNKQDIYTGKFNAHETPEYKKMIKEWNNKHPGHSQETYNFTYDDGTVETKRYSDLIYTGVNFYGWACDARRMNSWVDYTGDWWECCPAHHKAPARGNILKNADQFVRSSNFPVICRLKKCDAAFYLKKWKTDDR